MTDMKYFVIDDNKSAIGWVGIPNGYMHMLVNKPIGEQICMIFHKPFEIIPEIASGDVEPDYGYQVKFQIYSYCKYGSRGNTHIQPKELIGTPRDLVEYLITIQEEEEAKKKYEDRGATLDLMNYESAKNKRIAIEKLMTEKYHSKNKDGKTTTDMDRAYSHYVRELEQLYIEKGFVDDNIETVKSMASKEGLDLEVLDKMVERRESRRNKT